MSLKRERSLTPPPLHRAALYSAAAIPTASTSLASVSRPPPYPVAGPPVKRKKGEAGYGEPQEKRSKPLKRACPQKTQERVERVWSQRFFCVGRERTSPVTETFSVLGSTGNVYTVSIGHRPSCDCPDGRKGNQCKHVLFVLLKVLQVPESNNLWYQSALLTSELEAIFANARPSPRSQLEERVSQMYRVATGKEKATDKDADEQAGDEGPVKKRIPQEGDSCPICYEDFTPNAETGLVFCLSLQGCGNALHNVCFTNWERTAKPVTCPLCREKWPTSENSAASGSGAGPSYSAEGYLNFASQAGISTKRDTSSYYHGPRRRGSGRRGYDDYYDDYDDYANDYDDGFDDDDDGYERRWDRGYGQDYGDDYEAMLQSSGFGSASLSSTTTTTAAFAANRPSAGAAAAAAAEARRAFEEATRAFRASGGA
ncbi:hypothetical protein JCM10212_001486 [Sporobolomyces blumeae]